MPKSTPHPRQLNRYSTIAAPDLPTDPPGNHWVDNGAGTVGSYKVGSRDSHPGVRAESVPPVGSIPTGTFPALAPTLSSLGTRLRRG